MGWTGARRLRVTVDTGVERSKDVRAHAKVAPTMTTDGRSTIRIVRWTRPTTIRRIPEDPVPDVRPFRALRFDPTTVGDLGAVTAPPYDVIDGAARARYVARHPANVVQLDLPAERARRRARRSLPAHGPDAGRVALRRDPAQGPPSVGLRLRAGLPRARHGHRAPPARVLRPAPARGLRRGRGAAPRADDGRPQGGPLQAPARDRGQHQPGHRPVRRRGRRDRAAAGRPDRHGAGGRPDRRRRRPPSTVGRAGRRGGPAGRSGGRAHRRRRRPAR